MSPFSNKHLELNRRFHWVSETIVVESWESLRRHPYVVVLGEAGSGKTTEFKLRVNSLTQQGCFAFFLEISRLAVEGLSILDVEEEVRLEEWRQSHREAVFFLDSIDEAKLQGLSLQKALVPAILSH